jgi:putative DNA primase/helicase
MILDPVQVAFALSGEASGINVSAPGPGHSRADRSLSIRIDEDAPDGFYVHSFADDDWRVCREHVLRALGLCRSDWRRSLTPHEPRRAIRDIDPAARNVAFALQLWKEAGDPRGTKVEAYLASRSLALPDDLAGAVIRFHPKLRYEGSKVGAMLALFRNIMTDEPCGVHRTFLDSTARKLDRRMLGRAKGAAIKLDADENVTLGLHLGEGVETCLAARLAGFRPVWALGTASGFRNMPVLAGVEAISFLAENDDNGANQRSVRSCARNWHQAGREVLIVEPLVGNDLNDVWREAA